MKKTKYIAKNKKKWFVNLEMLYILSSDKSH